MKPINLVNPVYIYHHRHRILPKLREFNREFNSQVQHTLATIPPRLIELQIDLALRGFPVTFHHWQLARYRNIHRGKVGFLIGNGPSVRVEDLEKLKNQVTFCCNRFYLAYEMMEFRPTYTLASDLQTIGDFGQEIVDNSEGTVFLAWEHRPDISGNFIWLPLKLGLGFSENILQYIYSGGATLVSAIQLGYFMGINRFIFYGVDHDYKFVANEQSENVWRSAYGEGNHFIKNYRSGKPWCPPQTEIIEQAFQLCDQSLRSQGGWLKNGTRGGKLEVLERIDFDSLLHTLV